MRLSVSNLQELRGKESPFIRFSITVMEDDGTPLWTSEGWRFTPNQVLLPPKSGYMIYHKITLRFEEKLRGALLTFRGVKEMVESHEAIATAVKREDLEGEGEI